MPRIVDPRTQRVAAKAAHGRNPAGIEVLEERQLRAVAIAGAVPQRKVKAKRQAASQRPVTALAVVELVEFQVAARQCHLGADLVAGAAGGKDGAVAGIAYPA